MPQRILMDMIHLQFEAPYDLEKTAYVKIRRTFKNKRFNADCDRWSDPLYANTLR